MMPPLGVVTVWVALNNNSQYPLWVADASTLQETTKYSVHIDGRL